MSLTDDKQINSLIDKLKDCKAENKAIKELDGKHRKLLKDHIKINELLMVENKALKGSRNELLEVLIELYDSDLWHEHQHEYDGQGVYNKKIGDLIQKAEFLKKKEETK